jgi:hypothetical protein
MKLARSRATFYLSLAAVSSLRAILNSYGRLSVALLMLPLQMLAGHATEASEPLSEVVTSSPEPPAEVVLEPQPPELPKPPMLPSLPSSPSALQMEIPVGNLSSNQVKTHPWRIDLGIEFSATYDDNIFIQHQARASDLYFGITPIVVITWGRPIPALATLSGDMSRFLRLVPQNVIGNSLLVRYTPTATFFTRHSAENSFDEDLEIDGRLRTAKTLFEIEGRLQTLSSPDIDVGNRINREVYSAFADLNYALTEKTSIDSRLDFDHTSYQGGLSFTDIGERITLDYKLRPKTTLGLGAGFGFTNVEQGSNQYYEQGLLHFHYVPTDKVTLDILGGVEARQVTNGTDRTNPVFNVEASYAAGQSTVILLNASRRTETSAIFESQNIERTTVELNLRQLLFQKVYLTLGGGYQEAKYVDASGAAGANRTDDFAYFGVSFAKDITRWCSLRVGYRYQHNESTLSDFAFARNLADLQFHVQF